MPSLLYRTCSGCQKPYTTRTGFWLHMEQSRNPLCQAARLRLNAQASNSFSKSPLSPNNFESSVDSDDGHARHFEGDLFGAAEDYHGDDFGQLDSHSDDKSESDTDSEHLDEQLNPLEGLEHDAGSIEQRLFELELENSWEPNRELHMPQGSLPLLDSVLESDDDDENLRDIHLAQQRLSAEEHADSHPQVIRYSDQYPSSRAGFIGSLGVLSDSTYTASVEGQSNLWAPFTSEIDWKIARWAKLRGAGSTAFSDLLGIEGVCDALGLSYKNSNELNKIIDDRLPKRPPFKRHEVVIGGESFDLYARDIIECIRALWADPDFLPYLVFEPERHYADPDHTTRMYHDMNTGKWWWATQRAVEKYTNKTGITIIPIILSSDKTQLTVFGSKTAYPVYMTIGNLPKHIRRKPSRQGQVLLAYLPTTKLKQIRNKSARRRAVANLYHACMAHLVHPLETVGLTGLQLTSGDGAIRDGHPIFACHAGDYPEQVLVTCTKTGECPTCPAPRDEMGNPNAVGKPRDLPPILEALDTIDEGPVAFRRACKAVGLKPIQDPFWKNLPFVNIFRSITPDVLHQMYQGNIKHLISWIQTACGEEEIDARCRRLPPNHNIRLFLKGISHLSRVTGTEHDQICRFLLGLVIDIKLPNRVSTAKLLRAIRGLLDFLYLAKYPVHTTETLRLLDDALRTYHDNREVFVELGIRNDFNFPKDHFINHYRELIETFGTTDNYNTEYTERLHIDLAKDAYRATNSKDEYPQMTAWLDRRERVLLHEKLINRHIAFQLDSPVQLQVPRLPPLIYPREIRMSHRPSAYGISLSDIKQMYGATDFVGALARFVVHIQHPEYARAEVELAATCLPLPLQKVAVFHRIKFITHDPFGLDVTAEIVVDSIHCEPARYNSLGEAIPGRFDTAVINYRGGGRAGVKGYCVGQVRCVFALPFKARKAWFGDRCDQLDIPHHLAYIEWFTPFSTVRPGRNHHLYKVSRSMKHGKRQASVIPADLIWQSAHLLPAFGPVAPVEWKSSTVLEQCHEFYVNAFSDRFSYSTIF